MVYIIGVFKNQNDKIEKFRLIDITTGIIKDETCEYVYNAIIDKDIIVRNLSEDVAYKIITTLFEKITDEVFKYYPVIIKVVENTVGTGDIEQHENNRYEIHEIGAREKMIVIGVNKENINICMDVNGVVHLISDEYAEEYGLMLLNKYKAPIMDLSELGASVKIDRKEFEFEKNLKIYNNKRKLLGIGKLEIGNINGIITLVSARSCKENKVSIPSFVDSIGNGAFEYNNNIRELGLGSNIKYIGDKAFHGCKNLKNVIIPGSIESFGNYVFHDTGLEEVEIMRGVCGIYDRMFYECEKLRSIKIPDTVKFIGEYAFHVCKSLKSIELNENIEELGINSLSWTGLERVSVKCNIDKLPRCVFNKCGELSEVELTNNIKEIGEFAFGSCIKLNSIKIVGGKNENNINLPNNLEYIGERAFYDCCKLESIEIPDTVKEAMPGAFLYCTSLKHIKISKGMSRVRRHSLAGCSKLKYIEIPKNIKIIEKEAFSYCYNLEDVIIHNKNIEIELTAFDECKSLKRIKIIDGDYIKEVGLDDIYDWRI